MLTIEIVRLRRVGFGAMVLAPLVLVSFDARSDIWYVEPNASARVFYDDNVRLSTVDPQSSFGAIVRGEILAGRRTEVTDIGLGLKVDTRQYSDVAELDRTNGAFALRSRYQLNRHSLGFDANFDYDSTLTSEEATTGIVQVNKRRSLIRVRPSWRYELTERTTLDAGLSYEDVSYEDVDLIPLSNYTFARATLSAGYQITERLQFIAQAAYDDYQASQVDTQSTSVGVDAGLKYLLSETSSIRAAAGVRQANAQTPTEAGVVETDNAGPIFELEWIKDFTVGGIELLAERSLVPSGRGTLLDTTGITLAFDYPITERWTFGLDASGYRNRNPGGEISGNDRDFVNVVPRIERRLTEALRLDLSYRYRWQKREISEDDAVSNAVFLSVTYKWPREPLRRWSLLR
ncbi:hypothetical protein THIOKS11100023 [Thiocapsa sp. KS1]|nr:hypothetical protein [Thiocapsa sp. KS1]CRI63010.1 hypothetical protein THIOKS11100023 [Thiocapsa sp. KS1]